MPSVCFGVVPRHRGGFGIPMWILAEKRHGEVAWVPSARGGPTQTYKRRRFSFKIVRTHSCV